MQQGLGGLPDLLEVKRRGHCDDPIDDQRPCSRRLVADAPPAVQLGQRGVEALRGVGVEGEHRLTGGDRLAGPAVDPDARARTAPARPDGTCPHRAATPPAPPPSRRYRPLCRPGRRSRSRHADRSATAPTSRRPARRRAGETGPSRCRRAGSGGIAAVDPGQLEHLGGQPQRQLDDVGRARRRPARRATRRPRAALPTVAPSGRVHVGQQRAGGHPVRRAQLDHGVRQLAALPPRSPANAPEPTFTSSTSAPAPSASFLLITELAISGSDSTVAVMSRSA